MLSAFVHSRKDGRELKLGEKDDHPELTGITAKNSVGIDPSGCAFIVL